MGFYSMNKIEYLFIIFYILKLFEIYLIFLKLSMNNYSI